VSEFYVHEEYKPEDPQKAQDPYNDIAVIKVGKYTFRMYNA